MTGFAHARQPAEAALVSAARDTGSAVLRLLYRDPAAMLPRRGTTLRGKLEALAEAEQRLRDVELAEGRVGA